MLPASAVVKGKVPADFLPFQIDPWRLVADDRRAARTHRFHNYVTEVLSACWKKKEVVFQEFVPGDLMFNCPHEPDLSAFRRFRCGLTTFFGICPIFLGTINIKDNCSF